MKTRTALKSCALIIGATLAFSALAQNAPPPAGPAGAGPGGPGGGARMGGGPSPAERAIEYRKALYTVIGANYTPIGNVLQGRGEYNAADVAKRADRVAFLAAMANEAFPEISKEGNTKAKPDIWTNPDDFAQKVKAFTESTAALATLVKTDKTNSAAFKAAAGKVGESCKGCHDNYRAK
jgi:cytochrome c556